MDDSGLLPMTLALAVPLHIMQLQERGGPTQEDWDECQVFQELLSMPPADTALLHKVDGVTAMMFNRLARTIATMSYLPGGITTFGQHYETKVDNKTGA